MGASSKEDRRIFTACGYLLDHALAKGGQFTARRPTDIGLCLQGNLLTAMMDLDYQDERLTAAFEWMARRVTGDKLPRKINADGLAPGEGVSGPFRYVKFITNPLFGCRTNKGLSCGWAGVSVMMAFSRFPVPARTDLIKRAIETGIEFFFNTDPVNADFHDNKSGVPDKKWWQFKFPDFYPADILKLAEALTALGYGSDPRLNNTLNCIKSKQDTNGKWAIDYIDHARKMWVVFGSEGKPNKWITLRAMCVLKKAAQQQKANE